jgi:hypothetical protein
LVTVVTRFLAVVIAIVTVILALFHFRLPENIAMAIFIWLHDGVVFAPNNSWQILIGAPGFSSNVCHPFNDDVILKGTGEIWIEVMAIILLVTTWAAIGTVLVAWTILRTLKCLDITLIDAVFVVPVTLQHAIAVLIVAIVETLLNFVLVVLGTLVWSWVI